MRPVLLGEAAVETDLFAVEPCWWICAIVESH